MTNTRDTGLTGAGKGDAPRSKLDDNYRARFSQIEGMSSKTIEAQMYGSHFVKVGPGRWRKVFK